MLSQFYLLQDKQIKQIENVISQTVKTIEILGEKIQQFNKK